MSSGQNSGGLMSSAGLVRYFDAEDRNAIKMDPKSVFVFAILLGIAVQAVSVAVYGITV
ncbi:preprotein translocase subunit Sec61beta [Natronoarchaeum mannanilyticum]|uniref:Preprotein translocase subunit SecG n=1 Tax=Natronoarchaeum mannanilyticum TaxID=926360 RepID=A0AAV3T5X8_9EURY